MNSLIWKPNPSWKNVDEDGLTLYFEACNQNAEGIEKAVANIALRECSPPQLLETANDCMEAYVEFLSAEYNPRRFRLPNTDEFRFKSTHINSSY
jgi:hypothetical protein